MTKITDFQKEELQKKFRPSEDTIKPDDSRVVIAEMQHKALERLADDSIEVFSDIAPNEVFDVSRAILFSRSCLPSITERLKKQDAEKIFTMPILENFIKETFRNRHKTNHRRVDEFLEGMKALQPKNTMVEEPRRAGVISRLV